MAALILSPFPGPSMVVTRAAAIACIVETIAARPSLTDERAGQLGESASALVERFSPGAPQAIKNEAVIRTAGWLFARKPQPVQSVTTGPIKIDFRERFYAPDGLRNSGARALLTPWRTRRALPAEETS